MIEELSEAEIMKLLKSKASAESIQIVNNLAEKLINEIEIDY